MLPNWQKPDIFLMLKILLGTLLKRLLAKPAWVTNFLLLRLPRGQIDLGPNTLTLGKTKTLVPSNGSLGCVLVDFEPFGHCLAVGKEISKVYPFDITDICRISTVEHCL